MSAIVVDVHNKRPVPAIGKGDLHIQKVSTSLAEGMGSQGHAKDEASIWNYLRR